MDKHTASSVHDPRQANVTELIALLDRYLLLDRTTLLSHHSNVSTVLAEVAADHLRSRSADIPVSLQLFPDVDLSDHLSDLDSEKEEKTRLSTRISALCLDTQLVHHANTHLVHEYRLLRPDMDEKSFKTRGLTQMLALIRQAQRPQQGPEIKTFSLTVVTNINRSDGKPLDMETYHLPIDSSWHKVQGKLTTMSMCWQARDAGFEQGYSLKDGKWMYQLTKGFMPQKTLHDLTTAEQYLEMRRNMDKDEQGVLIWHELVWNAAQRAKAEAENEQMDVEDGQRNEDGTLMFYKNFTWDDVPDLVENQMRGPSPESLSEDERDKTARRKDSPVQ